MANKDLQGTIDAIHKDILWVKNTFVSSPDLIVPKISIVSALPSIPDSNMIYIINSVGGGGAIYIGGNQICGDNSHGGGSGGTMVPPPLNKDPRNLAFAILGREVSEPKDITEVINIVHNTIASGRIDDLNLGDYISLAVSASNPFVVAAGYDSGGAINLTANADLGEHGRHLGFRIVSKNGHKGKNGIDYDHVIFEAMNVMGYSGETNANGHYMEATDINTNGYLGCKMRQYVLNCVLPTLKAHGIPFDENWIKAIPRKVSKGGSASNPGNDTISDKLFLGTEYERFGAYTYSNSQAEAPSEQGRWEYYDSNTKRIKYNKDNLARYYWSASPYSGSTSHYCYVRSSGAAYDTDSSGAYGCAPAFCVA